MSDWNVNKRLPQVQHLQVMLNMKGKENSGCKLVIVERKGFKMLVKKLKPIYSIPGRNEVLVPILWKCPSFTYNINGAACKLQAWKTPFSIFYFIIRNIDIVNFLATYHPPSLALLNMFPTVSYHRHKTTFFLPYSPLPSHRSFHVLLRSSQSNRWWREEFRQLWLQQLESTCTRLQRSGHSHHMW